MSPQRQLDDLLADRALWGLSGAQHRELEQLRHLSGVRALDGSFETTAAAITMALLGDSIEPAPADVLRRLEADAVCFWARHLGIPLRRVARAVDDPAAPATPAPRRLPAPAASHPRRARLPWLLAAAAVVAAIGLGWDRLAPAPSPAELRQALLESGAPLVRFDWQPGPSGLRGEPSGDVVWSDATQAGFLAFRGLPHNDPQQRQYQLWIFDRRRSVDRPVDGGVFDIPAGNGEVVVPIDAKLRVGQAFAFAVTVEAPGGVVVSGREDIVTVANL